MIESKPYIMLAQVAGRWRIFATLTPDAAGYQRSRNLRRRVHRKSPKVNFKMKGWD